MILCVRCRVHGIDGGALHWDAVGHVACGTIADGGVPTQTALTYSFCLLREVLMGIVDPFSVARAAGLELTGKSEGLTLTDGCDGLRADFTRMHPRLKQGRLQQRAAGKGCAHKGIERPWAIDATANWRGFAAAGGRGLYRRFV